LNVKQGWGLVKEAASAWVDDYASSMGAALAYYTMFSIAPLLLIVISIAGLVFGQDAARGEILVQLRGMMGDEGARAVEGLLESVNKPAQSVTATIVGAIVLLFGATTVFGELQSALDRIWRAPARETVSGVWDLLRSRLLSFGMILGIGFLLMVSLVASAAIAALGKWWGPVFESWKVLASAIDLVLSFGLMTVLFALIYKIMPRVHIRWHDVWIGAAATALLFDIGKFLIGLYIGRSSVASTFGAAGSLVVMLMWVYYSAQIFLLGAEFTWVYAHTFGSRKGQAVPAVSDIKPVPTQGRTAAPSAMPEVVPTRGRSA
jgi:membrane protein